MSKITVKIILLRGVTIHTAFHSLPCKQIGSIWSINSLANIILFIVSTCFFLYCFYNIYICIHKYIYVYYNIHIFIIFIYMYIHIYK